MRHPTCRAVLLASALAAAAPGASAQAAAGLRALALPEGQPTVCRAPEPGPSDPPQLRAFVRREFVFGPPTGAGLPPGFPELAPREVTVVWDSGGGPRMLNDQASPPLRDATNVLALFGPDGSVAGRHIFIAVDSARIAAALASGDPARASEPGLVRPPVSRELTPEEGAQARALAAWLWARRCRGVT